MRHDMMWLDEDKVALKYFGRGSTVHILLHNFFNQILSSHYWLIIVATRSLILNRRSVYNFAIQPVDFNSP